MKKHLLKFLTVGLLFLSISGNAQIPSYIPKDSLVGWWPFNGNANDESGNKHNGYSKNVISTKDRFGKTNSAFQFNGIENSNGSQIITDSFFNIGWQQYSISFWFKIKDLNQITRCIINTYPHTGIGIAYNDNNTPSHLSCLIGPGNAFWHSSRQHGSFTSWDTNTWYCAVLTKSGTVYKQYLNGKLTNTFNISQASAYNLLARFRFSGIDPGTQIFNGKIDDIGIWKRALDSNEIKRLNNANICLSNSISKQPNNNAITKLDSAFIQSKYSDSTYSALWQSKHVDMPWTTLVANSTYSFTSKSLTIKKVSVSNHNQWFRVIYSKNDCKDTSKVATLIIIDTCINPISVQDTLIINAKLTGTNPLQTNLIKVYPNPAKDHLVIDFGNYSSMAGYEINIFDVAGKSVYSSTINKSSETIDLKTWSGKGVYFIKIYDKLNQQIENRKIVIQ
jgi:hypothetical protein